VKFVTWTLRYPSCDWVHIEGLENHYEQARVEAERLPLGFKVQTSNVREFRLVIPAAVEVEQQVQIDGQNVSVKPDVLDPLPGKNAQGRTSESWVRLSKQGGRWVAGHLPLVGQTKRPRRQGPIDDAFTRRFICVRGTGQAWNPAVQRYAGADLERFKKEWSKYLRGDLVIVNDKDLTEQQRKTANLILFGDPGSNSVVQTALKGLPLTWDRQSIQIGDMKVSAADHVPVMIHPFARGSLNYVVLNSGHTFHEPDFKGTNALLYPRLGDYALLKLAPTAANPLNVEVVTAGLFDEYWQLKK
jgi:hypothetical protein